MNYVVRLRWVVNVSSTAAATVAHRFTNVCFFNFSRFYLFCLDAVLIKGFTALMTAAIGGHLDCMELLIKGGVDLNQANNDVSTRLIVYVSPTSLNTRHTHSARTSFHFVPLLFLII